MPFSYWGADFAILVQGKPNLLRNGNTMWSYHRFHLICVIFVICRTRVVDCSTVQLFNCDCRHLDMFECTNAQMFECSTAQMFTSCSHIFVTRWIMRWQGRRLHCRPSVHPCPWRDMACVQTKLLLLYLSCRPRICKHFRLPCRRIDSKNGATSFVFLFV